MDEKPIISLLRKLKAELERRGELARTDSAASGLPFSEIWSAGRERGLREAAELIEYLIRVEPMEGRNE